jgi:hypothetical protein
MMLLVRARAAGVVEMQFPRPLRAAVDWFEARGVYVPGEDNRAISPWRDFGWLIATWLVTVGLFVIFFALAA